MIILEEDETTVSFNNNMDEKINGQFTFQIRECSLPIPCTPHISKETDLKSIINWAEAISVSALIVLGKINLKLK